MNRNGIVEQMKFYRTQPPRMKSAPWDFEIEAEQRRKAIEDRAVFAVCVICGVALYAWIYLK